MITAASSSGQNNSWQEHLPDFTPMLDMLFILLVFFMLTVGTVFKSLDLVLPSSVTKELPHEDMGNKVVLEINDHSYALKGAVVADFNQLKEEVSSLIKTEEDPEVVIAGDKNISIEKLLNVLTYLQSQGIEAANILMQDKEKP